MPQSDCVCVCVCVRACVYVRAEARVPSPLTSWLPAGCCELLWLLAALLTFSQQEVRW